METMDRLEPMFNLPVLMLQAILVLLVEPLQPAHTGPALTEILATFQDLELDCLDQELEVDCQDQELEQLAEPLMELPLPQPTRLYQQLEELE